LKAVSNAVEEQLSDLLVCLGQEEQKVSGAFHSSLCAEQ
jgi:hypothetical protein